MKRAVSSPKRLISLIVFCSYYIFFFIRPFDRSPNGLMRRTGLPSMELPSMHAIEGVIFGIFLVISLMMILGTTSYRGGFRPADVDVLFPTPVNPKVVLVFRIVRDYLLTLIMPLLMALLGWRGTSVGVQYLFRNLPGSANFIFRAMTVSWILLALGFVTSGYAVSLFVNRSDKESDRNRLRINLSLIAVLISSLLYIALTFRQDPSFDTYLRLAHSAWLRIVFFGATAATSLVMAPLTGNLWSAVAGLVGLVGISAVSIRIAMTQVGWMYDQAAAKGFDQQQSRQLQKQGDTFALVSAQAKSGKVRVGRVTRRIAKLKMTRSSALLWKDVLLQFRATAMIFWAMGLMYAILVGMITWKIGEVRAVTPIGIAYLSLVGSGVFLLAMIGGSSGFIEMLRRVDLQKPLPFSPTVIVFWEVIAKAFLPSVALLPTAIVAFVCRPAIWAWSLSSIFLIPAYSILLTACIFLVIVLFPDMDDPTQRSLRGLLTLVSIIIAMTPVIGIFGLLIFLKMSPLIAMLPSVLLCSALSVGLSALAGTFYAGYNPSE